jgi:hypothetical protein
LFEEHKQVSFAAPPVEDISDKIVKVVVEREWLLSAFPGWSLQDLSTAGNAQQPAREAAGDRGIRSGC